MRELLILAEAEAALADGFLYHETHRPGRGEQFLKDFLGMMDKVRAFPEM